MPKRVVSLSDAQVSKAKARPGQYALRDGDGLYLLVTPTGGKLWRFDYRYEGKRLTLAIGSYPEITLAEARAKREEHRRQVANGINPNTVKKILRTVKTASENSFEAVAREWHAEFKNTWCEKHGFHKLQRLESNIFPWIGKLPIDEITAPQLLAALRIVQKRDALDLAHRIRTSCVQVFQYAIATGRASRNVATDLRGALPPVSGGHHAAITAPLEVGKLWQAIDGYNGQFTTICALKLLMLFMCRTGELRQSEWSEFDFAENIWNVPAGRMKMKVAHLVPLCKQSVSILKQLSQVTGGGKYVFPAMTSPLRCMSENTINTALRRMGYTKEEVTGHGFRATARTILDEVLKVRTDLIEHQLAHTVRDPNGRAYNRTAHVEDRTIMMQTWADYLDEISA